MNSYFFTKSKAKFSGPLPLKYRGRANLGDTCAFILSWGKLLKIVMFNKSKTPKCVKYVHITSIASEIIRKPMVGRWNRC